MVRYFPDSPHGFQFKPQPHWQGNVKLLNADRLSGFQLEHALPGTARRYGVAAETKPLSEHVNVSIFHSEPTYLSEPIPETVISAAQQLFSNHAIEGTPNHNRSAGTVTMIFRRKR